MKKSSEACDNESYSFNSKSWARIQLLYSKYSYTKKLQKSQTETTKVKNFLGWILPCISFALIILVFFVVDKATTSLVNPLIRIIIILVISIIYCSYIYFKGMRPVYKKILNDLSSINYYPVEKEQLIEVDKESVQKNSFISEIEIKNRYRLWRYKLNYPCPLERSMLLCAVDPALGNIFILNSIIIILLSFELKNNGLLPSQYTAYGFILLAISIIYSFYKIHRLCKRVRKSLTHLTCPDCAYDLDTTLNDQRKSEADQVKSYSLLKSTVEICPECGLKYPLIPPQICDE